MGDTAGVPDPTPELTVADAAAWRAFLAQHHADESGVWLVLAKKGTTEPTTLSYDQALEEALCHGWIDGQVRRRDERTYLQRFTPRRPRSVWSRLNVARVEQLTRDGRMHPAGLAQVERARRDGRWDAAYEGSAAAGVPPDLETALRQNPAAAATFAALSRQNRFAVIYRVQTAARPETRERRIATLVEMLARGESPHPQRIGQPGGQ